MPDPIRLSTVHLCLSVSALFCAAHIQRELDGQSTVSIVDVAANAGQNVHAAVVNPKQSRKAPIPRFRLASPGPEPEPEPELMAGIDLRKIPQAVPESTTFDPTTPRKPMTQPRPMQSARQKWDLAPSTLSAGHSEHGVENLGEAGHRQSLRHSVVKTTSPTAVEARAHNVDDPASSPDSVATAKPTPNAASQQGTVKDEYKNSAPAAVMDLQESSGAAATHSQSAAGSLPKSQQQEGKEYQHGREQQRRELLPQQDRRQIRRINMLLLLDEQDRKTKKMASSASHDIAALEERALSPW